MTSKRLFLCLVFLFTFVTAVAAEPSSPSRVTLTISGMHCEGCASGISAMLKRTEGVVKADVSYDTREATIDYDATKTAPAKLIAVIEKMGYKAAVKP